MRRRANSAPSATGRPCTHSCASVDSSCSSPCLRRTLVASATWGWSERMSSTKAVRLPDGPTSTKHRTPSATIACTVSRKRTVVDHCAAASLRTAAGASGKRWVDAHEYSGTCGGPSLMAL